MSEYLNNERNKREIVINNGSVQDMALEEMEIVNFNKTGIPTIQPKKRKADDMVGKYLVQKSKNDERKKQEAIHQKNVLSLGEESLKLPPKKVKLNKIDENLLSNAARQLPLKQEPKTYW